MELEAHIFTVFWAGAETLKNAIFPFHFKKHLIKLDEIEKIEALQYKPLGDYGGWGIRYGFKGKAYNVSGNKRVKVHLKNKKNILFGSQKHNELAQTLKKIKKYHPTLPVIMITKNEEEWLMEEAIAAQISQYLTKPVNPSQILIACKDVLESKKIQAEYVAKDYLDSFQKLSNKINDSNSTED